MCGEATSGFTGIEGAGRLDNKDLAFFRCDRFVLPAFRHNMQFAGFHRHVTVFVFDRLHALIDEKQFVRVFVLVLDTSIQTTTSRGLARCVGVDVWAAEPEDDKSYESKRREI